MKNPPRVVRRERGVILFIALIVLVAMSLTGIAVMRSVDTSVLVAGNIAYRQVTRLAADSGVEAARTWLNAAVANTLWADQPSGFTGYWSTMQVTVDLTGTDPLKTDFNWSSQSINAGTDANGNTVRYVIHRMCDLTGDPAGTTCVRGGAGSGGGVPAGEIKYGAGAITGVAPVVYRVTAKVTGPRNTVSFVQVMVI